jgi:hypothetical protein
MRSLGGLVLLAGIGVGLFVYLPAPGDSSLSLEAAQREAEQRAAAQQRIEQSSRVADADAVVSPPTRSFAPKISLASFHPSGSRVAVLRATHSPAREVSGGWQAAASGTLAQTSAAVGKPQTRYELIVEIQQQLKRAGCYYGRVDGSWGAGSKRAMRAFTDKINATLPVEQPDEMLLGLLRAQSGHTCGSDCPAGLTRSASGQCMAKPAYAQAPAPAPAHEVMPWKTAAAEQAPAVTSGAQPLFRPASTSVVSSAPLPGRMSIGGPKTLPPVNGTGATSAYSPSGRVSVATANVESNVESKLESNPGVGTRSAVSAPTHHRKVKSRRSHRRDPIRHNLMLSLGGTY